MISSPFAFQLNDLVYKSEWTEFPSLLSRLTSPRGLSFKSIFSLVSSPPRARSPLSTSMHLAHKKSFSTSNVPTSSASGPRKPVIQPSQKALRYGEKDVWAIFTPLANQYKSVNLGQGFPNFPAADFVKESVKQAVDQNFNQYSPSRGHPHLTKVLAEYYGPLFKRTLNPNADVMVSSGANQAILAILQSFLDKGDEVLVIEPFFDIYKYNIEMTDGKMVTVPLRLTKRFDMGISANDWKLDMNELESKVSPKTKILLFNTPHNPTGKNYSEQELASLAQFAIRHNLLVISDEVYDQLYFETPHVRIASLPGMWERTLTVGSAGKTFGVTGWRVGWIIGDASLVRLIVTVHARTLFCVTTPLQEAVALSFEKAIQNGYFDHMRKEYARKRDYLTETLESLGIPVAKSQGSFFLLANFEGLQVPLTPGPSEEEPGKQENYDYALCRWLTKELGITAIPPSAFYSPENASLSKYWVRLCFAKTDETLGEARARFMALKAYLKPIPSKM